MKKLLSVLTLCSLTATAQAACLDWAEEPPTIPAGDTATVAEMFTAQETVKEYVKEGMEELECARSDLKYNYIVYRMKNVASSYNQELYKFKNKLAQR